MTDESLAFEDARELCRSARAAGSNHTPALTRTHARLYSASGPSIEASGGITAHVSPRVLFDRFTHSVRRDRLHFDNDGNVRFPAVELKLESVKQAQVLATALAPWTAAQTAALSTLNRPFVSLLVWALGLVRRLYGERVIAFFDQPGGVFYGSVYTSESGAFVTVVGATRSDVESGVNELRSLVS